MSEDKKGRIVKDYLNDILENIKDINVFIADIDYDDLKSDKKTQYAVIRCLEVIGEAAKKIPDKSIDLILYPDVTCLQIHFI